jgi:ATP-binding cassette subfamily B protein
MSPAILVIGYTVSLGASKALREYRSLAVARADHRLQRKLSTRMFNQIMALPLSFHIDSQAGGISQTLVTGLIGYRLLLQLLVLTVLPVMFELCTMGAVLGILGQPTFLLIIATSAFAYTITFFLGARRMIGPAGKISEAQISANATLTDCILNYESVKYFSAEKHLNRRLKEAFQETEARWAIFSNRRTTNGLVVAGIFLASLGSSIYAGVLKVEQGYMSVGDFVLVNTYVLQIFAPMERLGTAFLDLARGIGFIGRMTYLLRLESPSLTLGTYCALEPGPISITFDHVSVSYGQGRSALSELNFSVRPARTTAIIGMSGAGKSTLVRVLVRLIEPSGGRVLINGTPISEIPPSILRDAIAVVPQNTTLFNESIAYNIAIGRPNSTRAEIVKAAEIADLHEFITAQPNGYNTMVGEQGVRLSGGEKQRIAIARAALKRPLVLVLDEATSSLDARTEQRVLGNINEFCRNVTVLVIAHRLSTLIYADEIVILHNGSVLQRGTHSELLHGYGLYKSMWASQMQENAVPCPPEG